MLLKTYSTSDIVPCPIIHTRVDRFNTDTVTQALHSPQTASSTATSGTRPNREASKRAAPAPEAKIEAMERITYKGGVKAYWKRRGYYRLDAAAQQRRRPLPTVELGAGGGAPAPEGRPGRRRRGWSMRRGLGGGGRRLLRALSPRRWLVRLRDAYVSAMLTLASSPAVGYGAPYCATCPEVFPRPGQLKEYDEKVLVEIYRSILARGGQLAVAGGESVPAAATLRLPMAA